MKRTTISLLATATALAAITAVASLTAPDGAGTATEAKAPARLPIERSSLLCPAPGGSSELAETRYTAYTPPGRGSPAAAPGEGARAELVPSASGQSERRRSPGEPKGDARDANKPVVPLDRPGRPVSAEEGAADAPALVGTATGALAPGWTAQQTTVVAAGATRGLLGLGCTPPATDLWIPGASTAKDRQDYVHLTNPDDSPAVVDVEMYGKDGELETTLTEGIPVPARASVPILLSTLTAEVAPDVTVHVATRSGRIGAAVRAGGAETGSDWITAAAGPSATAVLPGIPADATSVRLIAYAPGDHDAELKVELAGPSGRIVPAGAESLHVKAGMTAGLDLGDVTRGEPGSLIVSPEDGARATPVAAALLIVRGKGDEQEIAFIPATVPVGERATVADNRAKGTTLSFTAPRDTARVRVTASAGTGGGEPAVKSYTVRAGTTLAAPAPVPAGGKGSYALTIETESGGPVHASRMLALPEDGIEMFTVQTFQDDRGTVAVPHAEQDVSVLND
ncbi:DUF5719 family protein [Streptomyces yaizuensis]|uniref:DUF5719 family protein n=1 Tax=Streptomyces yaizuensis TaxID=2989713 RepID=A0ABQ5P9J6_9ACTN|nr:DUF5719 family protein [Streptomyces sp. YSPA8]GLF99227.1 DUF5719 family protein [Streptomyces sp. YSPA8]